MSIQLTTSSPPAPLYNILPINTRDETFNNIMTIQLGTFPLHLCCCAAPCHSYDYDMHFPWPYAHATPPPLPTTQPQPTWPLPQPSTAPTFPSPQPSAYPHPQPQPFQTPPFLPSPTATALTYGTPSTWTFVQPSHMPPQPTHPTPVFPSAAPPPSYLLPPLHPTPPAEPPPPTTLTHPLPTPQQAAVAHHPSTDPQCAIPQGVWQPYSAFPTVASAAPSTSHRRSTTSPASTPTTDAIGPHNTGPTRHHNSHGPFIAGPKHDPSSYWLPTFRITIHYISDTSSWTFTTCNGQARHHRLTGTTTTFPTATTQQSPPPPQEPTQVRSSPPRTPPPPPPTSTSPPLKAPQRNPATPFTLHIHLHIQPYTISQSLTTTTHRSTPQH